MPTSKENGADMKDETTDDRDPPAKDEDDPKVPLTIYTSPRVKIKEILDQLPEEVRSKLPQEIMESESEEQFVARALTGGCPKCGNEFTTNMDDLAPEGEMGDSTVGVCPECDFTWCLECGMELTEWPCPHWAECVTYCKQHNIYQGEDGCLQEGYEEDYGEWLEGYSRRMIEGG